MHVDVDKTKFQSKSHACIPCKLFVMNSIYNVKQRIRSRMTTIDKNP